MAAIKKFFEKRKLDVKFKRAGEGHKLSESARAQPQGGHGSSAVPRASAAPTREQCMAASAAAARAAQQQTPRGTGAESMSTKAIKRQVKGELEAERKAQEKAMAEAQLYSAPREIDIECSSHLAVSGVYFRCPMVGPEVLPKAEMESRIKEFLLASLAEEPAMSSALMIHTLNKDKEKCKVCIDTLCKYLDNLTQHPGEEKFRKIRVQNKALQERVLPIEGASEFLQSAGYMVRTIDGPNQIDEDFYVMDEEMAKDVERIQNLKDILIASEPIKPELDRNVKVFNSSPHANRMEVPDEFYSISPEELKREQQRRNEAVERLGMLRTKEMREREKMRELRKYRYAIVRIRFPSGVFLQGTFRATEKMSAVSEFVRENMANDWMPFYLSSQTGQRWNDEELTLAELGLAPATLINFQWDPSIMEDIAAQQGGAANMEALKAELLAQVQHLTLS